LGLFELAIGLLVPLGPVDLKVLAGDGDLLDVLNPYVRFGELQRGLPFVDDRIHLGHELLERWLFRFGAAYSESNSSRTVYSISGPPS